MGKKKINNKYNEDDDYKIYTQNHRRRFGVKKVTSSGSWTMAQNQIYINFLGNHTQQFQTQFTRRSTKVFRKMSNLLKRRDPEQCRSHHQKQSLKTNGDINKIISYYTPKVQKWRQKMSVQVKKIPKQSEKNDKMQPTQDRNAISIDQTQFKIKYTNEKELNIQINLDNIEIW